MLFHSYTLGLYSFSNVRCYIVNVEIKYSSLQMLFNDWTWKSEGLNTKYYTKIKQLQYANFPSHIISIWTIIEVDTIFPYIILVLSREFVYTPA